MGNDMSRTIRGEVLQAGASHSQGTVRDHTVAIDRPVAKGGSDQGPMGGELIMLGLAGCFMSNMLAAIAAREAPISDVRVAVEAVLEGTPERMTSFTLRVEARGEDRDLLEKLATISERGCIAANTLKAAAPITVVVGLLPT